MPFWGGAVVMLTLPREGRWCGRGSGIFGQLDCVYLGRSLPVFLLMLRLDLDCCLELVLAEWQVWWVLPGLTAERCQQRGELSCCCCCCCCCCWSASGVLADTGSGKAQLLENLEGGHCCPFCSRSCQLCAGFGKELVRDPERKFLVEVDTRLVAETPGRPIPF